MMRTLTLITLTPFTLRDLRAILRLEQDVFPEDTYGMSEFLSLHVLEKNTFLLAWAGDSLLGYIVGYVEDDHGYIVSLAVDPSARRQGIGRQLMETVITRLIENGARRIGLHVRQDNVAAIALYESFGFLTGETISEYYEDGSPAIYMERRI
jgi:ribosomal-protein-alanine N-acetyltransferase